MKKSPTHTWEFAPRFRAKALGWSGSATACQRIKEAIAEIRSVAKKDPITAAEGAIYLIGRFYPAFQQVDSSSGALGSAINRAVETLSEIVAVAPVDVPTRAKWMDRLWEIYNEDRMGYLDELVEHWGKLCASPEVAGQWADTLLAPTRNCWEERAKTGAHSYFNGTEACMSCLLAAGRYQELLDLLEQAPFLYWDYRKYGVQALMAQGLPDDAITYAQASQGRNVNPVPVASVCEEILLAEGREDEAYEKYALVANPATTYVATFRALKKKYPGRLPQTILQDLIAKTPGDEAKWFASAKDAGLYGLALELVQNSPAEPKTLIRAARDFLAKNPEFALGAALAALHWIVEGYGYDIVSADIREAHGYALQAAELLGKQEPVQQEIQKLLQANTKWSEEVRTSLGLKPLKRS